MAAHCGKSFTGVAGIVERFYKPELDSPRNPRACVSSTNAVNGAIVPFWYELTIRIASHDLARQLQVPKDPQDWWQDLCLLQPARRRKKRAEGHRQAALFHEGAFGESPAQ